MVSNMRETTLQRHDLIRRKIDLKVKLLTEISKSPVRDACVMISRETGFSPRTLRDIYYQYVINV